MKRIVALLTMLLSMAATTYAGPPLITDDAGTVDVGKMEIELSSSYIHDKESINGISVRRDVFDSETKITTGLYKNLGMSLIIPYTFSDRTKEDGNLTNNVDGIGDMTAELKYAFAEYAGINFAIKPSITMPTGKYSAGLSEGRWQYGGTLIASREFDEGNYALHSNLGYGRHDYRTDEAKSCNRSDIWFGSIAGEAKIFKGLTAVAELGLSTTQDSTTSELTSFTQVGARYELNEHMDIDTGLKLGLTKPEDDLTVHLGVISKF